AIAPLLLQDEVPPPDDDRGEVAPVRSPEPLAELPELPRVHAGEAADGIRVEELSPAALGFGRREVLVRRGTTRRPRGGQLRQLRVDDRVVPGTVEDEREVLVDVLGHEAPRGAAGHA